MDKKRKKNKAAVILGRKGGKSRSEKKLAAVRKNGKKGGRPARISKQVEECLMTLAYAIEEGRTSLVSYDIEAILSSKKRF